MPTRQPYFITTAIAYPNGVPHIGHAYEVIASDALARFYRLDGRDVFFMTGTDEHGIKMLQTAQKAHITPAELLDRNVPAFQAMDEKYNISYDRFIRTTEADHYAAAQAIWDKMLARGDIYLSTYSGWYSVRDEAFYGEEELTRGPDGTRIAPTGTPVEWVEEESYFFRLSSYQEKLLGLYQAHPDFIGPDARRNEVVSFVSGGLTDLSISRTTFDWGVPVKADPRHVMYVWVDALTNYLTGVGYPDEESETFRKYWPADVHIIGKDIVRFHAVYWPAFLMSAGLALPRQIYAHGFLFNRGEKMSKSVGNVIDPMGLADTYGVDQVRYFFLREVPFGQDGSYSHEAIINRINADLANDLGNLAQRSLSMIAKNCGGQVPHPGAFSETDFAVMTSAAGLMDEVKASVESFALHTALACIWRVVAEANRYFANEEPWVLRKTNPERMATVLYVTADLIRQVAILTQPFMPESSAQLLDLLGIAGEKRDFASLNEAIKPATTLPAPAPVFPRFVDEEKA
jgi:methionyl-tRNA synthetase